MRIRDCCILADTNSTDEKVRPLIGRKGTLQITNGAPLVFTTGFPGRESVMTTTPTKCVGVVGVNIFDALQKDDGTIVWGSAELIVYTCLGDSYNVRVACFNRA